MTTTEHMQIGPEYYNSAEECNSQKYTKRNSNPRYSMYKQTHFTAGDEEQFERFRNKFTERTDNEFEYVPDSIYWNKYENIPAIAVSNTFNYIFHKFKKGIFIQIRNNHVSVMLPFSKHNYTNEWSDLVSVDKNKYRTVNNFFSTLYNKDGRKFNPKYINKRVDQWYANNALIRYEYPLRENDSGVHMISDMFKELCKYRKVPDVEFFVNKRDYPLLRRDETESYDYIFGEHTPLVSHNYEHYAPLLSMCSTDEHADICIPTWDDWSRVSENKYFPKSSTMYDSYDFNTDWDKRTCTAVFRGGSTGFGLDTTDNMRLKIAKMALDREIDTDGNLFLDAGITKWNIRPRKKKDTKFIDIFDDTILSIPLTPFMSMEEQSKYKYIVYIDGHVSAYRLSIQLNTGSVVLLVQSKYKLWYSDLLQPYVHYVPIQSDLSDLYTQIQWCKANDDKCRQIGLNSKLFYNTHLCRDGIFDYLEQLLTSIRALSGDYIYSKPYLEIQHEHEKNSIQNVYIPTLPDIVQPLTAISLPPYRRTFDLLRGIQWFLHKYQYDNVLLETNDIVNSKQGTNLKVYTLMNTPKKILSKRITNTIELIHEAMIGLKCINSLLRYLPNFSYTFALHNNELLTEYFESQTLQMYLLSSEFKMQTFIYILIQISLALHTAQQQYLFIHYDLYPWNILLTYSKEPVEVVYYTDKKYIRFHTKIIPVIIDYGKSHCVYNNQHYGFIKPFSSSTVHDILCILLSSMYVLLDKRTLTKKELHYIFNLSTFFSGTKYTNGKYFSTTYDLKQFVGYNKKFAQMINSKKYELEEKTPLDFVDFLATKFHINLEHVDHANWIMRQGTSRHVYDYLLASNSDERLNTFISVLDRIHTYPLNYEYGKVQFIVFNRIINSIEMMCPNIPISLLEHTRKYIKKYKNRFLIPEIDIDIPTPTPCILDIFDNQHEFNRICDIYANSPSLPTGVHVWKQILIDYSINQVFDFDNVKYLQYISNKKIFS